MSQELPEQANAIIEERDGSFYPVKLRWLPRVGDRITLHSNKDLRDKYERFEHDYKVVRISHYCEDVVEGGSVPANGWHLPTIHVECVQP